MIYVISDTHFNHDREFIWKIRGFKSVEEANRTIIENWNNTVSPDDEVYMLGDFFLGKDNEYVKETLAKLNGKIHLIAGNHDTPAKKAIYASAGNVVEIVWATQIEYKGRKFFMCHYPVLTADLNSNPQTAVFDIFGHTHSRQKFYEDRPYMYNVACDAIHFTPVSIETIYREIEEEIQKCLSFLK